jgi:hypothetical protein
VNGLPVREREAVENAPGEAGRGLRRSLACPAARPGDACGHVTWWQERGVVGVDHGPQRLFPGRLVQQCAQAGWLAGGGPAAHRLLQQPQAHHVAQVPDRVIHSGFIGEIRPAAGVGEHRPVELDARK